MKEYTVRVYENGTKVHLLNGARHREDGPAVDRADGNKEWWLNSARHREDGPAAEYVDGTKFWFRNDKLHREDGPAIEWADGTKEWWVNGKWLTETEFNERMKAKSTKSCTDKIIEIDGVKYRLAAV